MSTITGNKTIPNNSLFQMKIEYQYQIGLPYFKNNVKYYSYNSEENTVKTGVPQGSTYIRTFTFIIHTNDFLAINSENFHITFFADETSIPTTASNYHELQ